jgi:hypothetical protein
MCDSDEEIECFKNSLYGIEGVISDIGVALLELDWNL